MLLDGTTSARPRPPEPPVTVPPVPRAPTGSGSDSSSGSGSTGSAPSDPDRGSGSGLGETVTGIRDGLVIKDGIQKLNGAGDSAYLRITPEVSAQGNWRGLMVGGKGQLGADLRVTQNGEGADATYTVRYDKQALAALSAEAGSETLGKGGKGAAGRSGPEATLKADAGVQTFDAIEMTFNSKEEATRAAETLQRLHLADAASDSADMAIASLGPTGLPLKIAKDTLSGGGNNPLANPMNEDGAPGRISQRLAGVSDADMSFLRDHVGAYETTIGSRASLAADIKSDMKYLTLSGEGRLEGTQRITRRVEMPTDDKDGSVTYRLQGGLRATGRENMQQGFNINGLPVEPKLANRFDLAGTTGEISLRYRLPKGQDVTTSAGGRPVPEAQSLSGTGNMELDSVSLRTQVDWRDQSLADPSRADMQRRTATVTFNDPDKIGAAAGQFFDGDFQGAARTAGTQVELEAQDIDRSGNTTQGGLKLKGGVAEAEVSLTFEAGLDDVTTTRSVKLGTPAAPADPEPTDPPTQTQTRIPPAPEDDGQTLAVLPTEGAHLRDGPEGTSVGIVQNGTFLRDQGGRQTDGAGQNWIEVSGTDQQDKPVKGWVRADLVTAHSSATGAMDASGRTNPTLEYQRHDALTVKNDDNLWNIAQQHGLDPQQVIALNSAHLRNPSLIFKGDTVYLPGTARGPKPEVVEVPAPPKPDDPATSGPSTSDPSTSGPAPDRPTGSAPSPEPGDQQPPAPTDPVPGRPDLNQILTDYQVKEDEMTDYTPDLGPFPIDAPFVGSKKMTKTEARLLDELAGTFMTDLKEFQSISSNDPKDPGKAYATANEKFPLLDGNGNPVKGGEDGHNDAFRHAYWNALMTDRFGEDFASAMGTAHEGVPGNPGAREAMDLYNNEVGRRIARDNPDASDSELADKVAEAVTNGEMVVIGADGNLTWSDQVGVGQTGDAKPDVLPGDKTPPDYSKSS